MTQRMDNSEGTPLSLGPSSDEQSDPTQLDTIMASDPSAPQIQDETATAILRQKKRWGGVET